MRILLISANRERMPYPVAPLGLAYIAQALTQAGHEVQVTDLCFSADIVIDLKRALQTFTPDLVGISLRNLDNLTYPTSVSYLPDLDETVAIVRQNSAAPIVLGGSGFSLVPLPLMQRVQADFGVVGEGDEAMQQLVASLTKGSDPAGIPGLLRKGSEDFILPSAAEKFSFPDRSFLDNQRYLEQGGMANLQTKRGCPFHCIYCTYPLLEGCQVRVRPVAEVVREMKDLETKYKVDHIYFVDDIFNYPVDYTEALLREMIAQDVKMNWAAFVNPQFLTAEMTALMARAGCEGLELGVDSGSPKILQNYGKGFDVGAIERACSHCREAGLPFALYLLLGGPGEDAETLQETVAFMDRLQPTAVIIMLGIRIYPQTALQGIAVKEGVIAQEDDLSEPRFYISPKLGPERLSALVTEAAMGRRGWIVPGLRINISSPLMEGIRRFGVRGPLWALAGKMKRARQRPLEASQIKG
jgi:radical SAM superfamily enzyme YgiQ (UPF0313 family)